MYIFSVFTLFIFKIKIIFKINADKFKNYSHIPKNSEKVSQAPGSVLSGSWCEVIFLL